MSEGLAGMNDEGARTRGREVTMSVNGCAWQVRIGGHDPMQASGNGGCGNGGKRE